MNYNSNKDLLKQLNAFVDLEDGFLEQNYNQLKRIIDNEDSKLQEEALNILHKSKAKYKMTDELLESVAILFESTVSDNVKSSCQELFEEAANDGKVLQSRVYDIWNEKKNRDEDVKEFFESKVCEELEQDFQLNDKHIEDMLKSFKASKKISEINNLGDLIKFIIEANPDYFDCQPFVLLIEQCLLKNKAIDIALPCFCRIIKEKKCGKLEECLQMLTEHVNKNVEDTNIMTDLVAQLAEAIFCAVKLVRVPNDCVKFLEDNLDNSNEMTRSYAFKILEITSEDKRYITSSKFNDWCDEMLDNLALNGVKIEKPSKDLLETITSLRFIDVAVFKNTERGTWKRELLVSSIFETFNVSQMEQMQFYTSWLLVEEKFQYHKSAIILSIFQISDFDSFFQILELISIIPEIAFDKIERMLSIYKPAPYGGVKRGWCLGKIQAYLANENGVRK